MSEITTAVLITLGAYNFLLAFVGIMIWTADGVSDSVETTGATLFTVGGGALLILGIIWFGIWLGGL